MQLVHFMPNMNSNRVERCMPSVKFATPTSESERKLECLRYCSQLSIVSRAWDRDMNLPAPTLVGPRPVHQH